MTTPLLSARLEPGLDQALRTFANRSHVVVSLDFDGVLAPIIDDPAASRPLPASAEAVTELAGLSGVEVAVVSGRDAEDLVALADLPTGTRVVGSHGAQWGRAVTGADGVSVLRSEPLDLDEAQAALLAQLRQDTEALAGAVAGAWVQIKPVAVVLHTRLVDGETARKLTELALAGPAARDGVHTVVGKDVVELSVLDVTKGDALVRLRQSTDADAVFYAGDDTTDENAFAVLDPGSGDVSVKVGDGATAAGYRVSNPQEITVVLIRLLELLRAAGR